MSLDPQYDRPAAAQILIRPAAPGRFAPTEPGSVRAVAYTASALTPEPGRALTFSQWPYLERFMAPCPPDQVTAAARDAGYTVITDGGPA